MIREPKWAGVSLWKSYYGFVSKEYEGKFEDSSAETNETMETAPHCNVWDLNLRLVRR